MSANVTIWMARLGGVGLGLVLAGQAEPTLAASFSTNLTRISLSASSPTAILSLRNEGHDDLRLQVSVFDWRQTPSGEMQLAPTSDVVFFPALLTLRPGQERKVRIRSAGGFAPTERAYRIFLDELPGDPGSARGIRMRTRIGLPVFVGSATAAARAEIDEVSLRGGTLSFRVRNLGTGHLSPGEIEVSALDAEGGTVVTERVKNWYVLAGGKRVHEIAIPPGACDQIRRVMVAGQFETATLQQTAEAATGACGPAAAPPADRIGE